MEGQPSIFRGKDRIKGRLVGIVTPKGHEMFEKQRRKLAKWAKRDVSRVSTGDVIESLARGDADTKAYIKAHRVAK